MNNSVTPTGLQIPYYAGNIKKNDVSFKGTIYPVLKWGRIDIDEFSKIHQQDDISLITLLIDKVSQLIEHHGTSVIKRLPRWRNPIRKAHYDYIEGVFRNQGGTYELTVPQANKNNLFALYNNRLGEPQLVIRRPSDKFPKNSKYSGYEDIVINFNSPQLLDKLEDLFYLGLKFEPDHKKGLNKYMTNVLSYTKKH